MNLLSVVILFFRSSVLLGCLVLVWVPAFATVPENLSIYILMGQSNMSGRGNMNDLPADFPKHGSRIWLYSNARKWQPALESLDSAEGQVDMVSADPGAGVGPGLAFAEFIAAQRPKEKIGLVPCAKGGSSIAQWKRGLDRDSLYGSCLDRIKRAKEQGVIKGLLWYQGESDTNSVEAANQWPEKFSEIIRSLRTDLGDEHLSVVYAQIADISAELRKTNPGLKFWDLTMAKQAEVKLPDVKMIVTCEFARQQGGLLPDGIHLSTQAQLAVGKRFGEAVGDGEKGSKTNLLSLSRIRTWFEDQ